MQTHLESRNFSGQGARKWHHLLKHNSPQMEAGRGSCCYSNGRYSQADTHDYTQSSSLKDDWHRRPHLLRAKRKCICNSPPFPSIVFICCCKKAPPTAHKCCATLKIRFSSLPQLQPITETKQKAFITHMAYPSARGALLMEQYRECRLKGPGGTSCAASGHHKPRFKLTAAGLQHDPSQVTALDTPLQ